MPQQLFSFLTTLQGVYHKSEIALVSTLDSRQAANGKTSKLTLAARNKEKACMEQKPESKKQYVCFWQLIPAIDFVTMATTIIPKCTSW